MGIKKVELLTYISCLNWLGIDLTHSQLYIAEKSRQADK